MKLKLNELPNAEEKEFLWEISKEWLGHTLKEDSEKDELEASLFSAIEPLKLNVWIYRDETELFFKSKISGVIQYVCVRCLSEGNYPLLIEFSGIFRPHGRDEIEIQEDPSNFFYSNDELDFSVPVREHLFLNLPLNPICFDEESCKKNQLLPKIQEEEFGRSEKKQIDPRWETLLKIKGSKLPKSSSS